MKKTIVLVPFFLSALYAQIPTGDEVLQMVDANMTSKNRIVTSKMVIHGRRGSRTIESKSWIEGEQKSFTEYTAPAREKGTKMLKHQDQLWIYSPSTDRTIQIAGHMLRQSVMGSDLSYEDMMEDPKLTHHYDATVTGTETFNGRSCWVVELTAKTPEVAYHSRRLWIDQERYIPLKEELYAKNGKLLKRLELSNVVNIEGRWYPKRILFKDVLKEGEGTEFLVETVAFDQAIPDYLFSKAALRR
jgi:outer membrane lipoprotein-sorting protein